MSDDNVKTMVSANGQKGKTYAGRVGVMLIDNNRVNLRNKLGQADRRKDRHPTLALPLRYGCDRRQRIAHFQGDFGHVPVNCNLFPDECIAQCSSSQRTSAFAAARDDEMCKRWIYTAATLRPFA